MSLLLLATCLAGSSVFSSCSKEDPEYVDLGLPSGTLWATCNVGANSPGEYGAYFAWGEIQPKYGYSWITYKYYKIPEEIITKYCTSNEQGRVDNKTELETMDDAATVNWGSDWQMPSEEQFLELIHSSNTTTTWTIRNGKYGRKITSKSNGNSIFLPAAGLRDDMSLYNAGSVGYYWSRPLDASDSKFACNLAFGSGCIYTNSGARVDGQSVRPVRVERNKIISVANIRLNKTELFLVPKSFAQLTATALPWYATNKNVKWESSNTDIASVDETGKVTALEVGSCTITCSAADGSGVKAECKVTVTNDDLGSADTHEYVDLGLPSGTLWATCNVGANSPEEYGDYFTWGETQPKDDYSWSTHKYCNGSLFTKTKYCINSDYGMFDNKTELEAMDDAATANWGSDWQMPSEEQCVELVYSSCTTTTWTTLNGVSGYEITSKSNGNSIFLPAAGYRIGTILFDAGSRGRYWSRSLYTGLSGYGYAHLLFFDSSGIHKGSDSRVHGLSVRPVRVH